MPALSPGSIPSVTGGRGLLAAQFLGRGMWHGFNWEPALSKAVRARAAVYDFLRSRLSRAPGSGGGQAALTKAAWSVAGGEDLIAQGVGHGKLAGGGRDNSRGHVLLKPFHPLGARDRDDGDTEPVTLPVHPRERYLSGRDAPGRGDAADGFGDGLVSLPCGARETRVAATEVLGVQRVHVDRAGQEAAAER